ncbi:MAG: putative Ig domain-containing protein, partial [Planctomycetota bacterium]|nr:putative Ig domain-containing protein [Planctomycetota bacterium]
MKRLNNNPARWAAAAFLLLAACALNVDAAQPPVIQSATKDSVVAGQQYTYNISATSTLPIISYNAWGLPTGLTVDTATGKIRGTTVDVGTVSITLSATNDAGTGTASLKLTVTPVAPNITSSLAATGSLGVPFSHPVTATGIPTPSITAAPLPPGLTFSGSEIKGKPLQGGTTFVTLTASNSGGKDIKTLTIDLTAPPVITSPLIIPGTALAALNYTITASNDPTHFDVVGGFPADLPLVVNPDTGQITGIPAKAGTYPVVLRAKNTLYSSSDPGVFHNTEGTGTATVMFAISGVASAPAITSPQAAAGTETVPFIYGITATNAPTSFSIKADLDPLKQLPPGLSLDPATGVISGKPALLDPVPPAGFALYTPTVVATHSTDSGEMPLSIIITLGVPEFPDDFSDPTIILLATATKSFRYQTPPSKYTFTDPAIGPTTFGVVFTPPFPGDYLYMDPVTGLLSGTPAIADEGRYTVNLTMSNSRGTSTSRDLTLLVNLPSPDPPIVITSADWDAAIAGVPYEYKIVAAGASGFGALYLGGPLLPAHLVLDNDSGMISGTPQLADVAGSPYTITLYAWNATQSAEPLDLRLDVMPGPKVPLPPTITSDTTAGAIVGTALSYTITTTPDYKDPRENQLPLLFSAQAVPLGLSLDPDMILSLSDKQAKISGIPTAIGTSNVTVSAVNATGSDTHAVAFTIAPLTITSSLAVTGQVGEDFPFPPAAPGAQYFIQASGNPNVFGASNLPPGLFVDTRTGLIYGVPTDTPGHTTAVFPVTITATNGTGTAQATLNITITHPTGAPPEITSLLTATATDGIPFSYPITATNTPTSFRALGLPDGLTVQPNGPGGGLISGITSQTGKFYVIIVASNSVPGTLSSDAEFLELTILQTPPVITSSLNVMTEIGKPFRYAIETTGSQPQTYDAAPLPDGLTREVNIISGIPTVAGVNPPVTLTVSNQAGTVTAQLIITVTQSPIFNPPTSASGFVGDSTFSFTVTATGFPAPKLTVDPNDLLNTGLKFQQTGVSGMTTTGVFSGAPAVAGTFPVPVTATNIAGTVSQVMTITINPVAITSPLVLTGDVNVAITPYSITATGDPTTFAAIGLPPGLTLSGNVISGTPSEAGTTKVTISASNGIGTATATLIIGISATPGAPAILSDLLFVATKNVPASYSIIASNNPTSYDATLPPDTGLSIDTQTGIISGTPAISGSFEITVSASNDLGTGSATMMVAIAEVAGGPAITSPLRAIGYVGASFKYSITSINGPMQSFGASNLPAGLAVDTKTGIISGQLLTAGTFNIRLSATNSVATAQATLVLTVYTSVPPAILGPFIASGAVGVPFDLTITVTGQPAPVLTATGLPPGLSLAGTSIIGVPSAIGSYSVTLTATSSLGSVTKVLVISIGYPDDADGDGFPD